MSHEERTLAISWTSQYFFQKFTLPLFKWSEEREGKTIFLELHSYMKLGPEAFKNLTERVKLENPIWKLAPGVCIFPFLVL